MPLSPFFDHFHGKEQYQVVEKLLESLSKHYGKNLLSCAVFGSYARKEARLNSDLDLFLVLEELPFLSRAKSNLDFVVNIENKIQESLVALQKSFIHMEVSPLILSRKQASCFNPLYFDMTEHVCILFDKNEFLQNTISATAALMARLGTQKVTERGLWYWKAIPDPKFGEPISYEI